MFAHNKRLQYTLRVAAPNPGHANLLLEQFGGPQGDSPQPAGTSHKPSLRMTLAGKTCSLTSPRKN
ncbi:protein of unknown function (plasmid) [Pararobbsia alpina]